MTPSLSAIFESAFAGVFVYLVSTLFLGWAEYGILKFWLRPYAKKGGRGLLARAKVTIFLCQYSRFYLLLVSLLAAFTVLLAFWDHGSSFLVVASHFAGFWVIPVFLQVKFTREVLPKFSLLLAITAAKRLVTLVDAAVARPILDWAAEQPHLSSRIAAVNGYMEITEGWAYQALEKLGASDYVEVSSAAKEACALVYAAVYGSGPRSLDKMPEHIAKYEEMEQLLNRQLGSMREKKDILAATGAAIDDVVYSQLKLKEDFPDLYCMGCYARAEAMTFREWEWVRCKRCHDVLGLRAGIKQVVGEIGGEVDRNVADGVLQISLWDPNLRQANLAEIDALLIVGGKALDYDWAINAVAQKLHNQSMEHSPDIPVRLMGEVPLSQNSRHLLQALNPSGKF